MSQQLNCSRRKNAQIASPPPLQLICVLFNADVEVNEVRLQFRYCIIYTLLPITHFQRLVFL